MRDYYSYRPAHRRVSAARFWATLAKLAFIGTILIFLGSFVLFPIFALGLPSPDKIVRREGFSTKIYDRSGKLLYDVFEKERRTLVKLEEVPEYLKHATVSIEDKNFYKHEGFDPFGILRALFNTATRGRLEGGSTLTQQLVKNVLLSPERTIFRKAREFILAVQIEKKYTKDEILQMYLNEAPYGGTAWGVQTAAETYFGKNVRDLTLAESAILAGLPQRPTAYSPYGTNPKAYIKRTEDVLRRMRDDSYISREQEEEAKRALPDIKFLPSGSGFKAPHFVMYVQQLLEDTYGQEVVQGGGLKVTTTLDLELQDGAQKIVAEEIEKVESLHITNGASVVLDATTGEILSMVGSKNFNDPNYDGQVNVTLSLRQPGSAIKPVTYLTALKKSYTASTIIMDVPTVFPGGAGQPDYQPVNYDGKYRGPLQLRYALGNSINIVAVKLLALVGIKDTLKTAHDLGITTLEPTRENLSRLGLSLTLGGGEVKLLELTSAYGSFANGGKKITPTAILKVEDRNGRVLEEVKPEAGRQVMTPEQAFIISDILSDGNARAEVFGTRSALAVGGRTVAVKTGTTNDKRDNWTIGWTQNQVVAGAWVGNNDNSEMKEVSSGVTGAAPIWRRIMQSVLRDKPNVSFDVPPGVVSADVDSVSGYLAHDGFLSRKEYFTSNAGPSGNDPIHKNACGGEYFFFREEDPTSGGGENRWQQGIDSWLINQSDSRYLPPADCGGNTNSSITIDFEAPKDNETILNTTFNVKVKVTSEEKIMQVELELDGAKIATFTSPPYETSVTTTNGSHTLRVKAKDIKGKEVDKKITVAVGNVLSSTPEPTP